MAGRADAVKTKKSKKRGFVIFTEDGERHSVCAPSLRTALRDFENGKTRIVAAVEETCLPMAVADASPFVAVLLSNPRFVAPPLE